LATRTSGNIAVDLWYTGAYELDKSGWELMEMAKLTDYFFE